MGPSPVPQESAAARPTVVRARNERIASSARRHRFDRDARVPFLCECSDDRCGELLRLTLEEYAVARDGADHLVAPGHQVDGARIVRVKESCWMYRAR